ncbi:hypothetical protein MMC26_001666 [Xylographa opegraphella]|nr:hypothetical protein [Xylographa opegraphella]
MQPILHSEPRGGPLCKIWRTHGPGASRRRAEMNELLESSNVRYRGDPAILYNRKADVEEALDAYDNRVSARHHAAHARRERRLRELEDREREEELMAEQDAYDRELDHYHQQYSAYQSGFAHGGYGAYSDGYGRGRLDGYDDGYGVGYSDSYNDYYDGYDDGWDARSDDGYGREEDAYWGGWKDRATHRGRRAGRRAKRSGAKAGRASSVPSGWGRITWDYERRGVPNGWVGGFAETIYDGD